MTKNTGRTFLPVCFLNEGGKKKDTFLFALRVGMLGKGDTSQGYRAGSGHFVLPVFLFFLGSTEFMGLCRLGRSAQADVIIDNGRRALIALLAGGEGRSAKQEGSSNK